MLLLESVPLHPAEAERRRSLYGYHAFARCPAVLPLIRLPERGSDGEVGLAWHLLHPHIPFRVPVIGKHIAVMPESEPEESLLLRQAARAGHAGKSLRAAAEIISVIVERGHSKRVVPRGHLRHHILLVHIEGLRYRVTPRIGYQILQPAPSVAAVPGGHDVADESRRLLAVHPGRSHTAARIVHVAYQAVADRKIYHPAVTLFHETLLPRIIHIETAVTAAEVPHGAGHLEIVLGGMGCRHQQVRLV